MPHCHTSTPDNSFLRHFFPKLLHEGKSGVETLSSHTIQSVSAKTLLFAYPPLLPAMPG